MAIPGLDAIERPWDPKLDPMRFGQDPVRNPNVVSGSPSREAQAWQQSRSAPKPPQAVPPSSNPAVSPTNPTKVGRVGRAARSTGNFLVGGGDDVLGAFRNVGGTATNLAKSTLGKLGALGAAGAGVVGGFTTDTEQYARRLGLENTSPGLLRDIGVRALGVAGDIGNAITFGAAESGVDALRGAGSWNGGPSAEALPTPTRAANAPAPAPAQPRTYPPLSPDQAGTGPRVSPLAGLDQYAVRADGTPSKDNVIRYDPTTKTYSGQNIDGDAQWVNPRTRGAAAGGYVGNGISSGAESALRTADIYRSMQPQPEFQTPSVAHSGNDWATSNNLRNLRVSAGSLRSEVHSPRSKDGLTDEQVTYRTALGTDAKAQGLDAESVFKTMDANKELAKTRTAAEASRYGDDRRLEGTRYTADQNLRGDIYESDGRAAVARQSAATAAAKATRDQMNKDRELDMKNSDRTREQFAVYDADGKIDQGATQRKMLAFDKVVPGYSTMDERQRKKHAPTIAAISNIYDRTFQGNELGVLESIFGNNRPQLDSMPDFKSGKLKRSGLGGLLPGQAGLNGYYVEMPDGRQVKLGPDLSENEINLLRRQMGTGSWAGGQ